ncbi:unnamed protein product [Vitrella brassicaformis CCMP3155]|uniref:Uncharacterized protein n=1 Tax=Vitrella brassicaformis (strain CCMP3155) TaxID=1169540 RepID=A0A0G4FIJ7_VITBC|nr:unnamed protein product [Vitrella brassicaformis CCMP3155]|eukprot:CEM13110.1 unnamed protein product [Vitrella brassicaformis CCMP3155]
MRSVGGALAGVVGVAHGDCSMVVDGSCFLELNVTASKNHCGREQLLYTPPPDITATQTVTFTLTRRLSPTSSLAPSSTSQPLTVTITTQDDLPAIRWADGSAFQGSYRVIAGPSPKVFSDLVVSDVDGASAVGGAARALVRWELTVDKGTLELGDTSGILYEDGTANDASRVVVAWLLCYASPLLYSTRFHPDDAPTASASTLLRQPATGSADRFVVTDIAIAYCTGSPTRNHVHRTHNAYVKTGQLCGGIQSAPVRLAVLYSTKRKAGVIDPPPAPQLKQQKLAAPIPSLVPAAAAAAAAGQAQPPAPTTGNGDRIGQRIMGGGGDVADESTAHGAAMVTKELVPRRVDMCNLEKVGHDQASATCASAHCPSPCAGRGQSDVVLGSLAFPKRPCHSQIRDTNLWHDALA